MTRRRISFDGLVSVLRGANPARIALAAAVAAAAACEDPAAEPELPPIELTIVSPTQGSALAMTQQVVLEATAHAQDIGPLPDDSVQWTVDGAALPPGRTHTLRLDAGTHALEVHARYGQRSAHQARTVAVSGAAVGTVVWRSSLEGDPALGDRGGLAAASSGVLYTPEAVRRLVSIGPDGSLRWRMDIDVGALEHAPAVLDDGSPIFGTAEGVLALDANGAQRWEYHTGQLGSGRPDVHGGVAIGTDGSVYFGTEHVEGIVVALKPDGTEKWTASVRGADATAWRFMAAPVISGDSLVVIAERDGKRIAGVHAATGAVRWRVNTDPDGAFPGGLGQYSGAVAANGDVVFGAGPALVRINGAGTIVWSTPYPTGRAQANAPAIAGGRIYLPTVTGGVQVYAQDGAYIGTFGPAGSVGGAVTVGRGDVLYVLAADSLRSYTRDGTLRFAVPIAHNANSLFTQAAPVIAPDGTVYVRSSGEGVVAVADTVGPSPNAEWPTMGGGNRRLGRRH